MTIGELTAAVELAEAHAEAWRDKAVRCGDELAALRARLRGMQQGNDNGDGNDNSNGNGNDAVRVPAGQDA